MSARVAVVSGAGTGIGQSIAVRFGALGWSVGVGGRRMEPLAETVALVEQAGGRAFAHALDVTDATSVRAFFDAVSRELGSVDVVINNAAWGRYGPLQDRPPDEIHTEIATKLTGGLYMAREGILSMQAAGSGGDLVFITSVSAEDMYPHHLPYAAANAGVEHAAKTLRLELEGSGIRVTVVRVGATIGTEFATNEIGSDTMMTAQDLWFRLGAMRHCGLQDRDDVAAAVEGVVTLPPTHQFELVVVTPTAPVGPLPATQAEYYEGMMRYLEAGT